MHYGNGVTIGEYRIVVQQIDAQENFYYDDDFVDRGLNGKEHFLTSC